MAMAAVSDHPMSAMLKDAAPEFKELVAQRAERTAAAIKENMPLLRGALNDVARGDYTEVKLTRDTVGTWIMRNGLGVYVVATDANIGSLVDSVKAAGFDLDVRNGYTITWPCK